MNVEYRELSNIFEQDDLNCIIHQCNCFHTFGAGIARSIKMLYPSAYIADTETKYGDMEKLGTFSFYERDPKFFIFNMYSQFDFGRNGVFTSYKAMHVALYDIANLIRTLNIPNFKVGIPWLIGCGIAGGNYEIVENIILDVFKDFDFDIVFVNLDKYERS